jgi:hypothetical protein
VRVTFTCPADRRLARTQLRLVNGPTFRSYYSGGGVLLAFSVMIAGYGAATGHFGLGSLIGFAFFGLLAAYFLDSPRRLTTRLLRRPDNPLNHDIHVVIDDEQLSVTSLSGTAVVPWSSVESIVEKGPFWVIELRNRTGRSLLHPGCMAQPDAVEVRRRLIALGLLPPEYRVG